MVSQARRSDCAGFTLIELMVVLAIIGILAAIAIPNFIKFQLRAKAGEGRLNLAGIRTAEEGYFAEMGTYRPFDVVPGLPVNSQKMPWNFQPCADPPLPGSPGYCYIGWEPGGDVYFNYQVATGVGLASAAQEFFAVAESDIDGDGVKNVWGVQVPNAAGVFSVPPTLGCTTVLNPSLNQPMTHQVGPCDDSSNGLTVF